MAMSSECIVFITVFSSVLSAAVHPPSIRRDFLEKRFVVVGEPESGWIVSSDD